MSKYADMGKWAEAEASDWLEKRSSSEAGFAWHRFPDTRSARNPLPAQPADFLVGWAERPNMSCPTLLEVKETANVTRLPKDKIGQYGKLRMFNMAGFSVVVLVFRSAHKDWVMLNHLQLFPADELPKSFPFAGLVTYPTAEAALNHLFS